MGKTRKKWTTILLTLLFTVITLIALTPVFSLLLASMRPSSELMRQGLSFFFDPSLLNFNNYLTVFSSEGAGYWRWYMNSLLISGSLIILSLFFSSMVGYALAMYNFRGSKVIFVLVLFVLMVPFEILMLPLYQLMIGLSLVDTYFAVILPLIVAPVAVFFFRQYCLGLPKELMDSARIDGCTEYGIFFKIMAPLMGPSFAAMAILQGLTSWNNFLWPLLVLRSNDMFTLPVGLATLLTPYGNNYELLFSGSVLTIIPIVILFLFFQKFFISGLTVGGVKG